MYLQIKSKKNDEISDFTVNKAQRRQLNKFFKCKHEVSSTTTFFFLKARLWYRVRRHGKICKSGLFHHYWGVYEMRRDAIKARHTDNNRHMCVGCVDHWLMLISGPHWSRQDCHVNKYKLKGELRFSTYWTTASHVYYTIFTLIHTSSTVLYCTMFNCCNTWISPSILSLLSKI